MSRLKQEDGDSWYRYELEQLADIISCKLRERYNRTIVVSDVYTPSSGYQSHRDENEPWLCDIRVLIPRKVWWWPFRRPGFQCVATIEYQKGSIKVTAQHPDVSFELVQHAVTEFQARFRSGSAKYVRNYNPTRAESLDDRTEGDLLEHPYRDEIARTQHALRMLHGTRNPSPEVTGEIARLEALLTTLVEQQTRAATQRALHEATAIREVVEATMESEGIQLKRGS